MLATLVLAFVAYLLGSAPWGLVIAQMFCGIDPRTGGSRNTGATNVARLCGFGWGVATLACDLLKGALPVLLGMWEGIGPVGLTVIGLAAVCGHVFSCFLNFKGGKAVATSIGVFAPLAFWHILASGVICILVIWRSGFVSLGSLSLVSVMPVLLLLTGRFEYLPLALCIAAIVFWRHRENIARLRAGQEKPWIKKKS